MYEIQIKPLAIKVFEKLKKITVIKSGFVININCPWLGYSPDGFFKCGDVNYLIEIKCLILGLTVFGLELLQSLKYILVSTIGIITLEKITFLFWTNSIRLFPLVYLQMWTSPGRTLITTSGSFYWYCT